MIRKTTTAYTCRSCGNALTIVFGSQMEGSTFRYDIARSGVCPCCGQRLLPTAEKMLPASNQEQPHEQTLPMRATLRAVRGLLRLALDYVERALETN